jgi:hypothetical protein
VHQVTRGASRGSPHSKGLLWVASAPCVAPQVLHLKVRPYIPDFNLAFQHFCIHTGGRGVIDAIEKQLELLPDNVAPSRETLYRYGNVSSASIWCAGGCLMRCWLGQLPSCAACCRLGGTGGVSEAVSISLPETRLHGCLPAVKLHANKLQVCAVQY